MTFFGISQYGHRVWLPSVAKGSSQLAKVCNTSGADNHHFYDLQMTANIIKDVNMKK